MALQTKTISYGSFEWKNEISNAYVLDLILTEESVDQVANTSLVSFKFQLRSGSSNRFTAYIDCAVTVAGESFSVEDLHIVAAYNYTYTLLTGSVTVPHNADGTMTIEASASINTPESNPYAPPDLSFGDTMTLTAIPRISVPTVSPSPVAAGGTLTIRTNRNSNNFTHTLSYTFGQVSAQIAEDVADSFCWEVPAELAAQIPTANTGWGKIQCTTYQNGVMQGMEETDFVLTIPQNEETRPSLAPELQPINTGLPAIFDGIYIQGKSKLQATVNAVAWHAEIAAQSVQIQGLTYSGEDPIMTDILLQTGSCEVVCSATDTRRFSGNATLQITVLPYRKPAVTACSGLSDIICCRCDTEGNPDRKGTRILLKARRVWYGLGGRNKCTLRYRIREGDNLWPDDWTVLLEDTSAMDEVAQVLGDVLDTKRTYQVQLSTLDTVGEESVVTMPIGTANTPLHLGRGGRNVGIGRYCNYEHEDAIDIGWDMFLDQSVNGVYLDSCTVSGTELTLQTVFTAFDNAESGYQALWLWGSCSGQLIHGAIGVSGKGETAWSGTAGVSVAAAEDGKIIVTIPQANDDQLVLMATHKFEIN